MPETIGLVILGALSVESVAIGFGITTAGLLGSAVITGGLIGLNFLLAPSAQNSQLAQSQTQKPGDGSQPLRQSIAPRMFGYGRCRIAGAYVLYEQVEGKSYDVLAIHSGKICGFVKFFLHEDQVEVVSGVVTSVLDGDNDGRYGNVINIRTRLGEASETAYGDLASVLPTLWSTDHRGDGIASLALHCAGASAEQFQKIYPHGLPVPSVVADLLALWDPRDTDQDPDDPATWVDYPPYSGATIYAAGVRVEYGGAVYISRFAANQNHTPDANPDWWIAVFSNPVLQIINYMTNTDYGMALDRASVIDPVIDALMVEVDLCDGLVDLADGGQIPRYTSNGWTTFETDPANVLGAILGACDGWVAESGDGTVALQVGVYRAPSFTIETRHILGFSVNYGTTDEEAVNEITLSFISPDHKYREVPGQPWRDEADITARGKLRTQALALQWVQSHSQARRLAKRAMARNTSPLRGSIVTTLYGLTGLGQRWITLDYPSVAGLDAAVVEIQRTSIDIQAGRISFDWIKIDPDTIDDWDEDTEEGMPPPDPDSADADELPVPIDLVVVALGDGGGGFYLDITFPDLGRPDLNYVARYRLLDSNSPPGSPGPWIGVAVMSAASDGTTVHLSTAVVPTGGTFEVEAASVGPGGSLSDWSDAETVTA